MNQELIEYYKNLLIMQYRDKTKALAHTGVVLGADMIYDIAIAVRDGFNIETAIGAQLDVLGRILGVSRTITGTTFTRAYYGYALYGDTTPFLFNPMLLYGAEPPDVQFRDYRESSQSLYDLTDEEYRVILKLAIVRNTSNASVKTIDEILNVLFGAECYFIDRMNMTVVSYMVGAKWSRIFDIAKSAGLLPNPAGVGTSLVVVPDINNIFAYSLYGGAKPEFAVGYGKYRGWFSLGNGLIIGGNTITPQISSMTSSRIAYINYNLQELQTYDFDGVNWVSVGNVLSMSNILYHSLAALSSSRIVLLTVDTLQAYSFDGINWTVEGNPLLINDNSYPSVTALSESRIAIINNDTLQAYDFDGVNWISVGNDFYISTTRPSITALSSSRIAFIDDVSEELRTYTFDGNDWFLTGNPLPITGLLYSSITAMTESRISFIDGDNKELRTYDFNETDWFLVGNELSLSGIGSITSITSLTSSTIAFIDSASGLDIELRAYDFNNDLTGCMASYS